VNLSLNFPVFPPLVSFGIRLVSFGITPHFQDLTPTLSRRIHMYPILLRLLLLASLLELGISLTQASLATLERAARQVLNVDWRPISVWPEEAGRFH